jgi:hypothetical protein
MEGATPVLVRAANRSPAISSVTVPTDIVAIGGSEDALPAPDEFEVTWNLFFEASALSIDDAPPPRAPRTWRRCGARERAPRDVLTSRKMEEKFMETQAEMLQTTRVRGMALIAVALLVNAVVKVRLCRAYACVRV